MALFKMPGYLVLANDQNNKIESIIKSIRDKTAAVHVIPVSQVNIVNPGELLRTANGKIKRSACRSIFQEGGLKSWGDIAPQL